MYPLEKKENAIYLRKKGYSINEIVKLLKISKATTSVWVRRVILDEKARKRLAGRLKLGRKNYIKSVEKARLKRKKMLQNIEIAALDTIMGSSFPVEMRKILCAFLFWAEGAKNTSSVNFTNSDPSMMATFVTLLRSCFKIDEQKFHAIVHIHEYHNDDEIKSFWSKITKIPNTQFYRSYRKPHTGTRKKEGYKGCLTVSYSDSRIALELYYLYNSFAKCFLNARS